MVKQARVRRVIATYRNATPAEGHAIIRALLSGCQRVLDLGCGQRHHTKHLPGSVWIDIDPGHASDPEVTIMDVRDAPERFKGEHFDAALLTDVLEHLTKEDGCELLAKLPGIADRIIVFSPLGELWMVQNPTSPHDHRSGWTADDFPDYERWIWPKYHRFADGNVAGAFFAWKTFTPSPLTIQKLSHVTA